MITRNIKFKDKTEYSEKELKNKAEIYCSAAERCPSDVEAKLNNWGGSPECVAAIMSHLFKEKYLDTDRFCRAFVRDKYRFNQWGRVKIIQALKMKGLTGSEIEAGLENIDEQEYHEILSALLKQKMKTIKASTEYEINNKLIRFAAGRGFTISEIMKHIKNSFDEFD